MGTRGGCGQSETPGGLGFFTPSPEFALGAHGVHAFDHPVKPGITGRWARTGGVWGKAPGGTDGAGLKGLLGYPPPPLPERKMPGREKSTGFPFAGETGFGGPGSFGRVGDGWGKNAPFFKAPRSTQTNSRKPPLRSQGMSRAPAGAFRWRGGEGGAPRPYSGGRGGGGGRVVSGGDRVLGAPHHATAVLWRVCVGAAVWGGEITRRHACAGGGGRGGRAASSFQVVGGGGLFVRFIRPPSACGCRLVCARPPAPAAGGGGGRRRRLGGRFSRRRGVAAVAAADRLMAC